MSLASNTSLPLNIYEETLNQETLCDCSSQGLEITPKIENKMLSVSTTFTLQHITAYLFQQNIVPVLHICYFSGALFTKQ